MNINHAESVTTATTTTTTIVVSYAVKSQFKVSFRTNGFEMEGI
jgi:hypothetical protein